MSSDFPDWNILDHPDAMDVQQGKQVNVVFRVAVKTNVRAVYVVGDDPQLGLGEENGTPKWDTRKGVHLRKRLIEKVGENSIWVGDPISVQSGGCLNYKYIVQCDDGVFWEKREDDRHIELPVGETQKEIDCDEVDYCRGPKIEENFPSPNTSATATTASRITNEVKQEPDPEEDFEHVGDEDGDNIRLEEKFQSMLDSQEKKLQEGFEAKLETLEWKAKQESDQYAAKVNELLKTVAKYGSVEALMRQAIAKQIEERTQEQAAAAAQLQTVLHEEVRKANEETLPAKLDKLKGELLSTSEENSQQKLKELEARLTKSFNNQLNVLKDDLESQRHDFTSLRQMTESFGKRFEAFKSEQKSEVTAQLDSKLQASETKLEEKLNQVTSSMSTTVDNAKVEVEGNFQNEVTRLQVELNKLRTETLAAQDGLEKQIEAKLVERLETAFEKESNHWTADLDSIKVLVQKETQGLMELKGNAEAQITEMKSRLCEFSTESQELNDALKKLEKQLDDERKKRRSDMKELATKKEVAELRESLQAEVQDERTRVEQLRDEFEVILDRVNKVDNLEEEQLRREENFTSSVRSWQTERERIQAEELKTMKAQIKEDTESMRQENRNFQHKIWRENEASNKKLKEQFEQEQTLLRTSDELSKQELLSMKQSVKDATAAMTQSVEDTNKAMTKSVEDMNKEMKESFEELQEEAYQTVQGRLEEVEQGIKEKEKELDIRGARLEEAFEDRTEKTEQQLNQSLQEQKQRFDELERNNQAKFQAHDKQLEGIEEELRQNFFPRLTDLERDKDSMQEDVEDLKKSISGATEGEKTGNSGAPGSDASAMCKSLETAIDDLRQDLNETKASTKELEKQLQGWADDVGSLKKEHPNLLKDVEELKKTLKKGERQQQRQQPATSTASSSASAANNFSSSSASTATSFSYANANAPSASAAAARPSEGGTGIPTSSPFAVDYIFSNPEAEQRAKKLLTELRDSRRRVNDQDRRRNLLKKAFLQVHPDHTGTEDPQIRRELRIWWEKWLEENKEWYIGDRTGSP
mmetsp:Transcript_44330/g.95124  ORF Transcript_44330/g.95124 Transcript_44330/m.95124 type:complete len:1042 (-) Transcript_44330:211-3336(-)